MSGDSTRPGHLGIIVNPLSGRDVRRLAARAHSESPQSKRNTVARAVIGAAAAGATDFYLVREPFQIATGAVENLRIDARFEVLDLPLTMRAEDSALAARRMREAGCGALIVLGGDGTNRAIVRSWRDAPLMPLSTGTNNVFPRMIEATVAGAAAGAVASRGVALAEAAPRAKLIEVEIEDEPDDLALVDAAFLVGDHAGNLLPFDPHHLRTAVLARAEASAVGMSPIGGLIDPCGAGDDFGVVVDCEAHAPGARELLVPVSPGLYRKVFVTRHRRVSLDEPLRLTGPGLLAFDGDRERELAPGQRATLRIARRGPHVLDAERCLALAAERGLFVDRAWNDPYDGPRGGGCC